MQHLWLEINLGKENLYIAACYIPHKESNYYNKFGLQHDDPFPYLCRDILVFERLGKLLIVENFNATVGKIKNMEISRKNILDPCLLHDSKDCMVMNYGIILIHMLDCTNLIVLNGRSVFPWTNVLTCLPSSSGGRVVDYVFMKACDVPMVTAFKISPLSPNSDHKPLHSHTLSTNVKEERRYIIRPCYKKVMIYAKEVEKHLSILFLDNDVKEIGNI